MERSCRAWLSIVVVQAMGSVWICYSKSATSGHYSRHDSVLSRAHALPLALLCVLRIVLIFDFKSATIHIAHILLSLLAVGHTMLEVFYFGTMAYNIVNVTEVTLNGFSALFMVLFLLSPGFWSQNESEQEKPKRARKVIAKHYMEGEMLTPDENDELVKEYKKKNK